MYKLGAIKNPKDLRDINIAQVQAPVEVPNEYFTDISFIPVLNQKGLGACFTDDTLIQLSNGTFKEIKSIIIGDEIIDAYGDKQIVTELFHRQWQGNMYEIYPFGMNLPIKATPEHPFLLDNGIFKIAKELKTTDKLVIPVNREVKDKTDFWYEKDKDFLRVLGLYLAEGCVDEYRVSFTMASHEEDIIEFINKTIFRIFGKIGYIQKIDKKLELRFNSNKLAEIFKELGLKGGLNKSIHSKFLLLEPELQYEIFYGWLLGDGSFKDKKQITGVSISKNLILQMFFICLRNNIIPNLRVRPSYLNHKEAYNLEINSIDCNKIRPDIYSKNTKRKSDSWRGEFVNGNLVRRIRKIDIKIPKSNKTLFKNGKSNNGVYNIETTGSHTYTANFFGVHNCVGHSHAIIHIYNEYKENGKIPDLSPRYIYALSKKIDGYTGEGTFPRVSAKIECDKGCATEVTVPNSTDLPHDKYITVVEDEKVIADAKPYKMKGYAVVNNNPSSLKQALIKNGLVAITISVGGYQSPIKKGNLGLHRVTLYGYKGDRFYFRNSWGESWGDKGNGYFDFADQDLNDIMVFTDLPNDIIKKAKMKYKYFSEKEIVGLKPELVKMLDEARGIAGVPFKLTSGYRTPEHNKEVGGVDGGSHTLGLAVDIETKNSAMTFKIVKGLLVAGFTRIGLYADGHVHADIATDKIFPQDVMWVK